MIPKFASEVAAIACELQNRSSRIVHFLRPLFFKSFLSPVLVLAALALVVTAPRVANAEALLLVEADSGKVLQAENATYPWYPASVT